MSTVYRIDRNIIKSVLKKITTLMESEYPTATVVKSFKEVSSTSLPCICVRSGMEAHRKVEIGNNSTMRKKTVLLDIFATSDGERSDIKDYLIDNLKSGFPYYEYVISSSGRTVVVYSETQNGRLTIESIEDTPINFENDRDTVAEIDRYRHLLTLIVSTNNVEV